MGSGVQAEKDSVAKLKRSLEQCQEKLQESNKMLESNQNVIAYLNKEINQAQMHSSQPPLGLGSDIVNFRPDGGLGTAPKTVQRMTSRVSSVPQFETPMVLRSPT